MHEAFSLSINMYAKALELKHFCYENLKKFFDTGNVKSQKRFITGVEKNLSYKKHVDYHE